MIETNEQGGCQSKIEYKFTDFDPEIMLRIAARSGLGFSKYGPKNYLKIPFSDHIDHALAHIYGYLAHGNKDGDELAGAVCRLIFAMEVEKQSARAAAKLAADDCGHDAWLETTTAAEMAQGLRTYLCAICGKKIDRRICTAQPEVRT